jgi:hypothetical protein
MSPRLRTYAEACRMADAERERLRAADIAAGKEPGSFYLVSWIPFDPGTLPRGVARPMRASPSAHPRGYSPADAPARQ